MYRGTDWWVRLMGYETEADLAAFAELEHHACHVAHQRGLEGIIGGWTARKPTGLLLGPKRPWPLRPGIPMAAAMRLKERAQPSIDIIPDPGQDRGHSPILGLAWRLDEQRPWYHSYILSAFAVSLVALLVRWLQGFVPDRTWPSCS